MPSSPSHYSLSPTPDIIEADPAVAAVATFLATQAEIPPAKPSRTFTELLGMPRLRGIYSRPGKVLLWVRAINHEALLASTRGQLATTPCNSCKHGSGPVTQCIVVHPMLKGSCTNCHYNSQGARCSLRPSKYSHPTLRSIILTDILQNLLRVSPLLIVSVTVMHAERASSLHVPLMLHQKPLKTSSMN